MPFQASDGEVLKMENWFRDHDTTCRVDLEPNWIVHNWLKDGIRRFCGKRGTISKILIDNTLSKEDVIGLNIASRFDKKAVDRVVDKVARWKGLNASQEKAVLEALSHRVHLIQGPPGTGKTTVIAALLLAYWELQYDSHNVQKPAHDSHNVQRPALCCAPSNVAVDIVLDRPFTVSSFWFLLKFFKF